MSIQTLSVLTPSQVSQYERDGYLVLPHLLTPEDARRLIDRVGDVVEERAPYDPRVAVQIEPGVRKGEAEAASFLASLRKVEKLCIYDEVFRELASDPRLMGVATDLLAPDIKLFRDALMMKPAHHGSKKPYHQDSAYWQIDPPELGSFWIALDEATLENGCMRVLPGSHRWGELEHTHRDDFQVDEEELDLSNEVAVPLPPGGALFFHSMLLHATSANESSRPRRAMIVSVMSAESRWTGDADRMPEFPLLHGREHPGCV